MSTSFIFIGFVAIAYFVNNYLKTRYIQTFFVQICVFFQFAKMKKKKHFYFDPIAKAGGANVLHQN
jgi:hypothetical protein